MTSLFRRTTSIDLPGACAADLERFESPEQLRGLADELLRSGDALPEPTGAPPLTADEERTLGLLCRGCSYAEMARLQHRDETAVKGDLARLREKLDADSLAHLVVRAVELQYLTG